MKSALKILDDSTASKSCRSVTANISDPRETGDAAFSGRAAVITLGCAKNQVDSEVMVGVLRNSGFEIVNDLAHADVAVINTCGFLESAVKESVDCVLEVSELKRKGSLRKLIVAGCMVERYKGDIRSALPEVDTFISVDEVLSVGAAALSGDSTLKDILSEGSRPYFLYDDTMPRHLSTASHTAYVKISEGCNRPCAFCIIPQIRGKMRSRSIDSILREVEVLAKQGVREINLVAQDLTAYGTDTGGGNLSQLLQALNKQGAAEWIRVLYAYPVGTDAELIDTIMESERVVKYLDVPLQHASENVLKLMRRPIGRFGAKQFVNFLRNRAPGLSIRTTFIVGFPGETAADVKELSDFIREGHFENVGVFTYSPEDGTPAFTMPNQIAEAERNKRRASVMKAQQQVAMQRGQARVGEELQVLVEGPHDETDMLLVGRAAFQAPEVDGTVLINSADDGINLDQMAGGFGRVKIEEVSGYDLVGRLVA